MSNKDNYDSCEKIQNSSKKSNISVGHTASTAGVVPIVSIVSQESMVRSTKLLFASSLKSGGEGVCR